MKKIFVDTSAWFALVNEDDINHDLAVEWFRNNPLPLFTTNHIFAETLTLIRMRLGHTQALAFGNMLLDSGSLQFYWTTPDEEKAAWQFFQKYSDKDFSFIDCISFSVMKGQRFKEAFAFDKHFIQAGFNAIPEK